MVELFRPIQPIPVKRRKPAAARPAEPDALDAIRGLAANPVAWQNVVFDQLIANQAEVIVQPQPMRPWRRADVPPPPPPGVEDQEAVEFFDQFDVDDEEEDRPPMPRPEKKMRVRADYSSRAFSTKSTRLPAFRMAYQGAEEMTLRLQGTIIQSHDTTLFVNRIEVVRCEFSGDAGMGAKCTFPDGSMRGVMFNPERTNLRSPDPGYIQIGNAAMHYHRKPARVYKQGINPENSSFFNVTHGNWNVFGAYPMEDILTSFDERPIIQWNDIWPKDYLSYRLCDRIALSRTNGGKVIRAHYKNKWVGHVVDRSLVLNDDIESDFWLERAFASVGIQIKPQG
jgi:hypothetical protein